MIVCVCKVGFMMFDFILLLMNDFINLVFVLIIGSLINLVFWFGLRFKVLIYVFIVGC